MSQIQSIYFERDVWGLRDAMLWLIDHNFNPYNIDITRTQLRFRQSRTLPWKYKRFATIILVQSTGSTKYSKNIYLVLGIK